MLRARYCILIGMHREISTIEQKSHGHQDQAKRDAGCW